MSAYILDKVKIRQSFSAASATYDGVAHLQRTVGMELLQSIAAEPLSGTVLDLGCGTGFLAGELLKRRTGIESVIALDLAWTMLQSSRRKLALRSDSAGPTIRYVCADAERLPFADRSLNGVFSNLALQWCTSIGDVLAGIRRILKPGSLLAFSTFGPETLRELKEAWAEVDGYSHVNDFYSKEQLRYFLEQAGFNDLQASTRLHRPQYDSVKSLMRELKHIGAHHVNGRSNKGLTSKTRMQGMIAAYEKNRENGLIPASFEVIRITARV